MTEPTPLRRILRRLFLPPLLLLVAIDLLLDEYLWRRFVGLLRWLQAHLPLAGLEARIRALPAWLAVGLFLLPGLSVLPFKLLGVWLLGRGAFVIGAGVFLVAKATGTGLAAWIFTLTRPTLLGLGWFRWAHDTFLRLSQRLHAWLEAQPWWQEARALARRMGDRLRQLRGLLKIGAIGRRLKALRVLEARRGRSEGP